MSLAAHKHWLRALAGALALVATSCSDCRKDDAPSQPVSKAPEAAPVEPTPSPLAVDPRDDRLQRNPDVANRIAANPHAYFRFVNRAFAQEVCVRFRDDLSLVPTVNLHGDVHVEQYAVTDVGRGLTDFDDSTAGPAVLDLMRLGVSLRLACEAKGWDAHAPHIADELFRGYSDALSNPDTEPPLPAVAKRVRSQFEGGRTKALALIDAYIDAGRKPTEQYWEIAKKAQSQMATAHPELGASFFATKRAARINIGIGSALDEKYLIRAEGKTASDDDDVVLEIKAVRDLSGIECIIKSPTGDPFRILTGQARIAYKPYELIGYVILHPRLGDSRAKTFWVHQWHDHYEELDHSASFESHVELAEIAYDAGFQLGIGHPNEIADPHGAELRRRLARSVQQLRLAFDNTTTEMTELVKDAWRTFRDQRR